MNTKSITLKASEYATLVSGNTLHLGNRVVSALTALGVPLKSSLMPALDPERTSRGVITSSVADNGDYTVKVEWADRKPAKPAVEDDDEL